MFFQSALTAKHGLESARQVASTSERILEVMNNATGMCQRLAASGTKVLRFKRAKLMPEDALFVGILGHFLYC